MKSGETKRIRAKFLIATKVCHYCTRETDPETKHLFPIVEHFIPRSREHERGERRLVLACAWCDKRKGQMFGEEYLLILMEETREIPFEKAMAAIKRRCKKINDKMSREQNAKIREAELMAKEIVNQIGVM